MITFKLSKMIMKCAVFVTFLCLNTWALASGFILFEGNGVNAANFSAGMAAGLFDASTAVYNPAALPFVDQEVVLAGSVVNASNRFSGSSTWTSPIAPGASYTEYGTKNGGTAAMVPAFHYAHRINEKLVVAISATSPFGLSTDNESTIHPLTLTVRQSQMPLLRYSGTRTSLVTIDISPSFGYRVTNYFSFGAGINIQYADVVFNSMAGNPLANPAFPQMFDTESSNTGQDVSFAYHLGILITPNDSWRFGVSYLSRITHHFHGKSMFTGPLALASDPATPPSVIWETKILQATTVLPDSILFGFFHKINPKFDILGTVVWTHWTLFKEIALRGIAAVRATPAPVRDVIAASSPQNFKDTWRIMVGGNYHYNTHIKLMAGLGYDPTPTNDVDRSTRLPYNNRFAIAAGLHYQYDRKIGLDVGWTHIFVQTAPIRNISETGSQVVTTHGCSKNHADVLGAQFTWKINPPAKMSGKFVGK